MKEDKRGALTRAPLMASLRGLCLRRVSGANTIFCHPLPFAYGLSRRLGCGLLTSGLPKFIAFANPVTPSTHRANARVPGLWAIFTAFRLDQPCRIPEKVRGRPGGPTLPRAEGQSPKAMGPWYQRFSFSSAARRTPSIELACRAPARRVASSADRRARSGSLCMA